MGATWPLVGRVEEQAAIDDALTRTGSTGVVLAGAAGVGKTRLAREVLEAAAAAGDQPQLIVATRSAASIPFGAFASFLDGLSGDQRLDRLEVLRDLLAQFGAPADGGRLVMVVDDAHLLDDSSAALVGQLVGKVGIAVVLTVRTGEESPDAIMAIWKEGLLPRIELQPLAETEIDALIGAALAGTVDLTTRVQLRSMSGGNALLLRELIEDGVHTGRLAEVDGVWLWSADKGPGPRLTEIVGTRIGQLAGPELDLVELVAVGEPVDLATVEALLPNPPLRECERRGLLAVTTAGGVVSVRLAHPLYGEVVRERLPFVEHDRLRRALADRLEAAGATDTGDLLRLATWRLECGEAGHGDVYARGAVAARRLFDHGLAERLARQALAAGPSFIASFALGESLIAQTRFAEGEAVLAALMGEADTDADRVRLADARLQGCAWGVGDFVEAERVLRDTIEHVADPMWRSYLVAQRASMLISAGRVTEALELAVPLFEDQSVDERVRLRAMSTVTAGWAAVGRSADAIAAAEASIEAALRLRGELPRAPGWAAVGLSHGRFSAGRLLEVADLLDLVASIGFAGLESQGQLLTHQGRLATYRGMPRTGAELLVEGVHNLRSAASSRLSYSLSQLAIAEATLGHAAAARRAIDEAMSGHRSGAIGGVHGADLLVANAWVMAAEGRLSEAGACAVGAAEVAYDVGNLALELSIRHDALRFGRTDQSERLAELAESIDGLWAPASSTHATALGADDGPGLDDASAQFEVIGAMLHAAECAAEAARAYERAGLKARATASGARATRLLQGCEGATTPALATVAVSVHLSRREREVASLAAKGLSNKLIAERLNINVRTVEGHVYQASAKLGVSTREDLAEALTEGT